MSLLEKIDSPADLKGLSNDELQAVAQEVRELIIDTIGEIGGHFGANLGACEIATVVHSLIESPKDKVLWDVGHQAYPHKILTGRRDRLHTIRKYGGLAPFCAMHESEHDIMGAGHASTAISYAVGLKEAMRHGHGEDGKVVAVVGDGALTGGVAFEALQNAGGNGTPIVIVLNDNGMSIAPNVGALSRYFNRARLNPKGHRMREGIETGLTRLPVGIGERIERLGPQLKESIKAFWAPGLLFEELDIAYVGVIDGHDVGALREAIGEALESGRPCVVHCKTVKGKGFIPAEDGGLEGMEKWHAAKPASIVDGMPAPKKVVKPSAGPPAPPQYTAVFGDALVDECERDSRVCGITAAMNSGTGLNILQAAMPERYYDVGIAEQHAVLMAAGMALQGMKPVAAIYSTFLQRGFDQIVHDVALQNLDVVFAMDRAGLVGDDGPTHHGVFDISYMRPLPNMTLMAPRDEAMLVDMLHTAVQIDGPVGLRYPRGEGEGIPLPTKPHDDRDRARRGAARGRPRRFPGLRLRRPAVAGRGEPARGARARGHRRRRALRQAARRRSDPLARRRARAARDGRGEPARGRLRLRRDRAARRRGPARRLPRHARRDPGPLRDARQAGAAARRGRADARGDRRTRHPVPRRPHRRGARLNLPVDGLTAWQAERRTVSSLRSMKRLTAVLILVAAALLLTSSPASAKLKSCGSISFSGTKTKIVVIRSTSCKTAKKIAHRYAKFASTGKWSCALAHGSSKYHGYDVGFSCGAGGSSGDLKKWPHAFFGAV